MAPSIQRYTASPEPEPVAPYKTPKSIERTIARPLQSSHSLDNYEHQELTRVLGREYFDLQVTDLLSAENSDQCLRDLGIVLAQRGVVVLHDQKFTPDQQKQFVQRLGEVTGKPKSSGLHIHPINHTTHELGAPADPHMSTIARNPEHMLSKQTGASGAKTIVQSTADGWHHDIGFERVTSDYSSLYMREIPPTGGDTLFASTYEIFDRISPHYQKFLESLTATFSPVGYSPNPEHKHLYEVERGSPLNIDQSLTAVHPVIRTNPVTGWKSVFALGHHAQFINELTPLESTQTLNFLNDLVSKNHDLQCRVKWSVDDLVLWDNRAVVHTATYDYSEPRRAQRVISVGDKPTLLPESVSRSAALGL